MDFLSAGVPIGRWFGIHVRLHFTFFLYAFFMVQELPSIAVGLAWVGGLYVSILLHEFGHALAARWCDGEANEILLWPLGGLAFVRPAWHPTAHLITTVAGPLVTLGLWIGFMALRVALMSYGDTPRELLIFISSLERLNRWLLLFNLIPAFPMDGGRILRDSLWHFTSAEKATRVAIRFSQGIAALAMAWVVMNWTGWVPNLPVQPNPVLIIVLALFVLSQSAHETQIVAMESGGTYHFSIRERLARGRRQRQFRQAMELRGRQDAAEGFHRCAECGRTECDAPQLEFRVCSDCSSGEEYCSEHLRRHRHR